jgi:hypothetical protein
VRPVVGGVDTLGLEVATEQRLLLLEHPAHVTLPRPHLEADREVGGRQRGLQDGQGQDVACGVVEEEGGAIERDDAAKSLGDGVEERVPRQVRDDGIVDLE